MRQIPWHSWVWGFLLCLGVIYSIYDYRVWQKAETANYGHGWGESADFSPAITATTLWQNDFAKFRLKYPNQWTITDLFGKGCRKTSCPVARLYYPEYKLDIQIDRDQTKSSLADFAKDKLLTDKDWEYYDASGKNVIVITQIGSDRVLQKAFLNKDGYIYVFNVELDRPWWNSLKNSLVALYQSTILL
jgi:hypothetical protein